jgi:hypothetical protein
MWNRGIPPWYGSYDRVTISEEAKRRFQKMVDEELESRKPLIGEEINVKIKDKEIEPNTKPTLELYIGVGVFITALGAGAFFLMSSILQLLRGM